ncbi:MAG: 8-oxo-dGTP pyrophosphatase MutT (NUDIX family) [Candidatus Aldehydirespiratoraceae bacterium]|jgi:8-oxo-dGTP pyrophosphatase MutT (NUDIX family)
MADLRDGLAADYPEVTIWAAGGLILRHFDEPEVLLIHRPQRQDWSFPKGKMDDGETLGQTAEREVVEETGYRCRRLDRLPEVRYVDTKDREKLVVYWTMELLDGVFVPNDEVDTLGWFGFVAARNLLTYERDISLLGAIPMPSSEQ